MHVNAKRMAFLGLLLAITVLLVILSGVLEFNTLFLLAAATFAIGIAIREAGIRLGLGFYIASILLSFILAPNKFYCVTYAFMGCYLLLREFFWERLAAGKMKKNQNKVLWIIKLVVFNMLYIPFLILFPKLIYPGEITPVFFGLLVLGGQAALFVYDYAYNYFQQFIWGKARGRFHLDI